jgi:predicted phosphodiesterase
MSDRVAVITDIHANLPALEAALARLDELGIEDVYCGGDLVGYGPHPNEVCALVEERAIPTIYGNYDHAIARDHEDCGCAYVTQADRELGQRSVEWTLRHTSARAKAFMRELPFDLLFTVGATTVHLVHGSPRKGQRVPVRGQAGPPVRAPGRRRGGPRARVRAHAQAVGARARRGVVRQLRLGRQAEGRRRSRRLRGARRPLRQLEVTIERVAYDADAVAAEVRAAGLPGEYADRLSIAA